MTMTIVEFISRRPVSQFWATPCVFIEKCLSFRGKGASLQQKKQKNPPPPGPPMRPLALPPSWDQTKKPRPPPPNPPPPPSLPSPKFRRRTNVQQLTCNMDLSSSFYYLFFSYVLIELKPFVLKGKVLGKQF